MKRKITLWNSLFIITFLSVFNVSNAANLTINFSSMTPHVGQELYLRIYDMENGTEIDRTHTTVSESFSLDFSNLMEGHNYTVDFFADFNGNGLYDNPPVDHTWRLTVENAAADNSLDFVHNTNFTDIMWPYLLTMDFKNMNPHVGQLLELRVVDKADNSEVGRTMIDPVPGADFVLSVPGIMPGHSYMVDFFADLNGNKVYDSPSADHAWRMELDDVMGDTTLTFTHNTNFTDIMWPYLLTMDFKNMNPHVGQLLELRVVDKADNSEVGRTMIDPVPGPDFMLSVPGIMPGHSYMVDFFADLNGNKVYDSPSADHAWRMEVDDVMGDTTLTFTHNTNFTDIMWPYLLTMDFKNMNPHVGQLLELRVVDKADNSEAGRTMIDPVPGPDFMLSVPGIMPGHSYMVDFFADLNGNKVYDSPSADHAWRMEVDDVMGDTTLTFTHNTNFTDIMWPYLLTMDFKNMNPHVGQLLELRVVDKADNSEVGRTMIDPVPGPDFMLSVPGIMPGHSYMVDFFADLNGNKVYDSPSADHAWRMEVDDVMGDTTLTFTHNTNFTDIMWPYLLTMDFKNMNPHVGQLLELRVVDKADNSEAGRTMIDPVPGPDFMLSVPGIMPGHSYMVDFFADLNGNKVYDSPSADHAWRMEVDDVMGDTTLTFTHNTNFTDIMWPYLLTMDFMSMTPHVGQMFDLKLIRTGDPEDSLISEVVVDTIQNADFTLTIPGIMTGYSYRIDFYADFNGNGTYDAPPADHAWRLELENVMGDTTLTFVHNTDFTDIGEGPINVPGYNSRASITVYPNPSGGMVRAMTHDGSMIHHISLYNITGQVLDQRETRSTQVDLDYSVLRKGVYFIRIETANKTEIQKLILR